LIKVETRWRQVVRGWTGRASPRLRDPYELSTERGERKSVGGNAVQTKRMEANAEGDRERERESNEKKRKNGARVSETRFELAGHLRDFMARESENHCSFRRASRKKTKKENEKGKQRNGKTGRISGRT